MAQSDGWCGERAGDTVCGLSPCGPETHQEEGLRQYRRRHSDRKIGF